MLWLVGLHVLAVIGYVVLLNANILVPMITGRRAEENQEVERPHVSVSLMKVAVGILLSCAVVYFIANA